MADAQLAPEHQIPAHVPPELVRRLGIVEGPEFLAAPHSFMAGLHETQPPVVYNVGSHGGAWQLTKYEDAFMMLRRADLFTTAGATPKARRSRSRAGT